MRVVEDQSLSHDLKRFESATAQLDPPFAIVDLDAFDSNAQDLASRAAGKPVRVASKSVRCRSLQQRALASPGFRGTLAFTLPEALWLTQNGFDDIVVAYPTTHRSALRALGQLMSERPELRLAVMVDSVEQLDFIDDVVGQRTAAIQICLDIDASWWLFGGRVRIGAKRSPTREPAQATSLAEEVVRRDGFRLVGLMAYEAQIAGVGNAPPGRPVRGLAIRAMQSRSAQELADRRSRVIDAVEKVAPLEFVNGGGTGSIERTVSEEHITEVAAGSGLFGPALFGTYKGFSPRPAALFALSVVRRPAAKVVTVLGGGYLASGPGDKSRLPVPYLPSGLRLDSLEGAGEVQTPLQGAAAANLRVGERVYFRHAKAGEMCERFNSLHLIQGDRIVDEVPTYRGEGHSFL
ncbi:MAG TPA: amino acid deaminase/aldolase [Actinomycetota bacterium]|nr:amino acid deaminase/aldolase [Actinomycetota bacterium]